MPLIFLLLTRSINASGKLLSFPNSIPIFFIPVDLYDNDKVILPGVKYTLLKSLFLNTMEIEKDAGVIVENHVLTSDFLKREVKFDIYLPKNISHPEEV